MGDITFSGAKEVCAMTRAELERLWKIKAEIVAHERALSDIEAKEAARNRRGTSFLHSLSPPRSEPDLSCEKSRILEELSDKRQDFLKMRAEIEHSISTVSNQQVRLAMSLHYVDLLTLRQAASLMGGNCTERSLQALISRYIRNLGKEGPMILDSS